MIKEGAKPNQISLADELKLIQEYKETKSQKPLSKILQIYSKYIRYQCNKRRYYNLPKDDLYQECCIALIKCLDNFNIERNLRLSTLLKYYIAHQIEQFVVSNITQVSINKKSTQAFLRSQPTEHSLKIDNAINRSISLDDSEIYTSIIDDSESADNIVLNEERSSILKKAFKELSDKERKIFIKCQTQTIRQIAEEEGISKSRVDQIHKESLFKMNNFLKKQKIKQQDLINI